MEDTCQQFVERASYDLETARAMLQTGRYLYLLFCCQQAVEKMLKGLIVACREEFPPRIRNLERLAQTAGLGISEEQADFLRLLSSYYIQSRYPEQLRQSPPITRQTAHGVLQRTEDLIEWFKSMF